MLASFPFQLVLAILFYMSPLRVALGNKPDWTALMIPRLLNTYDLAEDPLSIRHATWADIVVPLTITDYETLRSSQSFQGKALFPSSDAVRICDDKKLFREWFKNRFDSAFLPSHSDSDSKLLIARPRKGAWGKGAVLIESTNYSEVEKARSNQEMFVEEYILGATEFAQHILFDNGRVMFSALSTHIHEVDTYVRGALCQTARGTIVEGNEVPSIFIEMLCELNYSGTACIDYKRDPSGQIKIFEINPRMGGSLTRLANSYVAAYVNYLRCTY